MLVPSAQGSGTYPQRVKSVRLRAEDISNLTVISRHNRAGTHMRVPRDCDTQDPVKLQSDKISIQRMMLPTKKQPDGVTLRVSTRL